MSRNEFAVSANVAYGQVKLDLDIAYDQVNLESCGPVGEDEYEDPEYCRPTSPVYATADMGTA